MNDQLLAFWNRTKKYLDRIMVVSFLVMTVAIGYFFLQERNQTLSNAAVTSQTWQPEEIIGAETKDMLSSLTLPRVPFESSSAVIVMVQNPWELRTARDQEQVEQEALRLHNEARNALASGNLAEARRLANLARANKPDFRENDELLAEISARLTGETPSTP